MHKQGNMRNSSIESGNDGISEAGILKSESALSGFLRNKINTAVDNIIVDPRIGIRNEELLGIPSKSIEQELKARGYQMTAKISGTEIIKGLYSELAPYYYIPHIKNIDGTAAKISGEMLKSMYHDMEGGNEYEQMAVLSEALDMPADVLVFMINGF